MQEFTTRSPLIAFLYELMRDHVVPGDVEGIVKNQDAFPPEDSPTVFVLSNGHLAAYAEELSERLTTDLRAEILLREEVIETERRRVRDVENRLRKTENVLATERESLAAWLRARIAQQEQAFRVGYVSAETKANLEMEIGLARRYLEIVLQGKHRPDTALLGEWR